MRYKRLKRGYGQKYGKQKESEWTFGDTLYSNGMSSLIAGKLVREQKRGAKNVNRELVSVLLPYHFRRLRISGRKMGRKMGRLRQGRFAPSSAA